MYVYFDNVRIDGSMSQLVIVRTQYTQLSHKGNKQVRAVLSHKGSEQVRAVLSHKR